jgi:hypothetical protein
MADMEHAKEWLDYAQRDYDFSVDVESHFWPKRLSSIFLPLPLRSIFRHLYVVPPSVHYGYALRWRIKIRSLSRMILI